MDEKKQPDLGLEELLSSPGFADEISADESAIAAAGLTHPSDLELEKILEEARNEKWGIEEAEMEAQLAPTMFVPDTGVIDDLELDPSFATDTDSFKDDEFRATFGDEGEALDQVFSDQPIPQPVAEGPVPNEKEQEEEPVEKGRPKRRSGYGLLGLPHLAVTAVWLAIILIIGLSIGHIGWIVASDVLALGRDPISTTITIEQGDTIEDIAQKLQEAGLISYPGLFKFYAGFTDADQKIVPGTYSFNMDPKEDAKNDIVYDYMALVSVMSPHSSGLVVIEDLLIPEGYTCAQIFQLLEEKGVCTAAELESYIASLDPDSDDGGYLKGYWFLDGVKWGTKYSLEGYLFPNTYDFYQDDKPERIVKKMLDAFDANFNDKMKNDLAELNKNLGTDDDPFTIRDVIIIASMIEKETASNSESFNISSVIYNRLTHPDKYPYLNIDATIVYALGGKTDLTAEDLKIDDPYNTYLYKGLPPGPISSPGQNSIAAALDPADTGYYYYALNPKTERHHFSKTLAEHEAFLAAIERGENPDEEDET